MSDNHSTYLFHKPFNCLSQFTKEHPEHITLADYLKVESDVYPIGRLDKDSEGLLLLSNDKELVHKILHPDKNKYKTYIVQLEGEITKDALTNLRKGVTLRINKKTFISKPAIVQQLPENPGFPERNPPVRYRKNIPTSWVEIKITEGKKRQVRKMCAAVNFPVLRLIRTEIADYKLKNLEAGQYKKL